MQIHQEQILHRNKVTNFQHNCPEVLIVLHYQRQLAQVKEFHLVMQCMVQIPELSLQFSTEICHVQTPIKPNLWQQLNTTKLAPSL